MAVNHVIGEKHRNLQSAAHGGVLHGTVFGAADGVERAANSACRDFFADQFARHVGRDADQAQLADFFIDGHLLEQISHKHVFGRECRRWGLRPHRRAGQGDGDAQQTHLSHCFLLRGRFHHSEGNLRCRSDIVLVGDVRHPKQEIALSLD